LVVVSYTQQNIFELATLNGGVFGVDSVESAYGFCRKLATDHYENFPVASVLIPKRHRNCISAIYAFARCADDFADEYSDINSEARLSALAEFNSFLFQDEFFKKHSGNPIFIALHDSIINYKLPKLPFQKLLEAFKQDILFKQPQTLKDLEKYCSLSANPVGELVLRVFGLYNDTSSKYSDAICTGLQLLNFWQDLSIDLKNGRCFIPQEILDKHGLSIENLLNEKKSLILDNCLSELYNVTSGYFRYGKNLIINLDNFRLRYEIKATLLSGCKLIKKLMKMKSSVIYNRPKLNKIDVAGVLFNLPFYIKIK